MKGVIANYDIHVLNYAAVHSGFLFPVDVVYKVFV
jgi:hypothetical protein